MKYSVSGIAVMVFASLLWWWHLSNPGVTITAAQAARYPALNPSQSDAWVAPINGTWGLGRYAGAKTGWYIAVQRAYVGTLVTDDACGGMRVDGKPYPYTADFVLNFRDTGRAGLILDASDFRWNAIGTLSSLLFGFANYHGTWDIADDVHLRPGGTATRELDFQSIPRGSGSYKLDVSLPGHGSATIGTYAITPNGRKPDCPSTGEQNEDSGLWVMSRRVGELTAV